MGTIRLWVRFPVIMTWLGLIMCIRVLSWPTALFSGVHDRRVRRNIIKLWAHVLAPLLGMRIVVKGTPPEPPCYLVANHLSYVDIFVLNYTVGCIFVARGDVEHWPVIGFVARSAHIIFVDRESKKDALRVNTLIENALREKDAIAVFAESRISRGIDVEPFKSALIQPAIGCGIPVHYATISYETLPGCPPASTMVGWWRPEPFLFHVFRLLRNRGFTATIHFGEEPLEGGDRKELAARLHAKVRENFTPQA